MFGFLASFTTGSWEDVNDDDDNDDSNDTDPRRPQHEATQEGKGEGITPDTRTHDTSDVPEQEQETRPETIQRTMKNDL